MIHGVVPPFARRKAAERVAIGLGVGVLLFVGSLLAGWMGGWLWREADRAIALSAFSEGMRNAATPEERLAQVETLIARFPDNRELHLVRAHICRELAAASPESGVYRAEARVSISTAWTLALASRDARGDAEALLADKELFRARLQYADAMAGIGNDTEAMRAYLELLSHVAGQDDPEQGAGVFNNTAYLMLTGSPEVLDVERGLELAQACIKMHPDAVFNPAYLDTLAVAYWKNGHLALGLETSRRALALADTAELAEILANHDAIADALAAAGP